MFHLVLFLYRFDKVEPITHGVDTLNLCEISVDVADVGGGSWELQTHEYVQAKLYGK